MTEAEWLTGSDPTPMLAYLRGKVSDRKLRLADAIYASRQFDRMPALADAFERAGCDDADVLNHCRRGGVHARGCWVIDLLLGKE